jgi:hypothetical protein
VSEQNEKCPQHAFLRTADAKRLGHPRVLQQTADGREAKALPYQGSRFRQKPFELFLPGLRVGVDGAAEEGSA